MKNPSEEKKEKEAKGNLDKIIKLKPSVYKNISEN